MDETTPKAEKCFNRMCGRDIADRVFGGRFFGRIICVLMHATTKSCQKLVSPFLPLTHRQRHRHMYAICPATNKGKCLKLFVLIDFKVIKVSRVAFHNSKWSLNENATVATTASAANHTHVHPKQISFRWFLDLTHTFRATFYCAVEKVFIWSKILIYAFMTATILSIDTISCISNAVILFPKQRETMYRIFWIHIGADYNLKMQFTLPFVETVSLSTTCCYKFCKP